MRPGAGYEHSYVTAYYAPNDFSLTPALSPWRGGRSFLFLSYFKFSGRDIGLGRDVSNLIWPNAAARFAYDDRADSVIA